MPPSPTAISKTGKSGFRGAKATIPEPGAVPRAGSHPPNILGEIRRLLLCFDRLAPTPGLVLPKPSLPVRLALLVAGTTLPLIIFAAGIVYNNYKQDRQNATQRVLETVRSVRLVLDAEMLRITGALQVLSLTNELRDGDFEGFRRICQGFLDQYGEGGVVLVANREGRQVFSSLTSDAAGLPSRNNLAMVDRVFAEKKPVYSNLFFGSVKKRLIVTVEVPVIQDDQVLFEPRQ